MGFSLFPKNIKQWKVVLIAFLAATTFWFFNALNKEYTTNFDYPVTFTFDTDSLIAVRPLPKYVSLDVTSGGWTLLRKTAIFSPQPLEIDLSTLTSSSTLSWFDFLPSFREQIGDVSINGILNDTLKVRIEPILQKKVALKIDSSSILLDEGYRFISPIKQTTDSILLSGPKSFIDTLGAGFIVRVPQSGIDDDFSEEINVRVPRPNLILSSPSSTEVSFQVAQFERVNMMVDVEWMNTPISPKFQLDSQQVMVSFFARSKQSDDFSPSDFIVIADYSMLNKSDTTVMAMLTAFPSEIEEVRIYPENIKLEPK